MRALPVTSIALLLTLCGSSLASPPDVPFLLGFLSGEYRLIGQQPDSGPTYSGRVTLRERDGRFEITRTVTGVVTRGTAAIETSGEGTSTRTRQMRLKQAMRRTARRSAIRFG